MIIMKMSGGLGNQLFQYACGRALAKKYNSQLLLDISFYNNHIWKRHLKSIKDLIIAASRLQLPAGLNAFNINKRPFLLNSFPIKAQINTKEDRVIKQISESDPFIFDSKVENGGDNVSYQGYFNSFRYFSHIATEIRSDLTPNERFLSQSGHNLNKLISSQEQSISIHVRRGDYLTNPAAKNFHGQLDKSYYHQALEIILDQHPQARIFVFSDEPDWCKNNLDFKQAVTFISGQSALADLLLMSRCHHHIIANSTFSWWGAWLNSQPDKIVIAPANWLSGRDMKNSDLFPSEWTIL